MSLMTNFMTFALLLCVKTAVKPLFFDVNLNPRIPTPLEIVPSKYGPFSNPDVMALNLFAKPIRQIFEDACHETPRRHTPTFSRHAIGRSMPHVTGDGKFLLSEVFFQAKCVLYAC